MATNNDPPQPTDSGLTCDGCGEDHKPDYVFMHSKCHIDSPTWLKMHKTGHAELICAECERVIIPDLLTYLAQRLKGESERK